MDGIGKFESISESGQNVLFVILALFFSTGYAQKQKADYLVWFDTTVGIENTPLFEGLGYVEQFKSINERHKFFLSQDFLSGTMVSDDQSYYRLQLKYDLFADKVLVQLKDGFEAVALQPEKTKIQGFTIAGSEFRNIGTPDESNTQISGFFEILFTSPTLTLLKKHRKKRNKKVGDFVYYEFLDDNFNVLLYDGSYHIVDSNRDFRRLFPNFKKEIKKYRIKKSDKDKGMIALLNRLSLVMSTENVQ
ncbi:MAG TPA: hypothetical protein VFM69_00645 [Pricia sp.]|nr:hypothetical protein [Pricia sp.]